MFNKLQLHISTTAATITTIESIMFTINNTRDVLAVWHGSAMIISLSNLVEL